MVAVKNNLLSGLGRMLSDRRQIRVKDIHRVCLDLRPFPRLLLVKIAAQALLP